MRMRKDEKKTKTKAAPELATILQNGGRLRWATAETWLGTGIQGVTVTGKGSLLA
jgi:hypothetical protein